MDMCMCAALVGGLPGLCPGISKSLVTPLLNQGACATKLTVLTVTGPNMRPIKQS